MGLGLCSGYYVFFISPTIMGCQPIPALWAVTFTEISASLAVNITLAFSATPLFSLLIQGEFIPVIPFKIKYIEMQKFTLL